MKQEEYKVHFIYTYNKSNSVIRWEKSDWLLFLKRHFAYQHTMAKLIETCNYNSNDVYYTYKEFAKLDKSDIIVILSDLCDKDDKVVQLKIKYANKLKQLGKLVFDNTDRR